jgi:hypothetical protein
VRPLGREKKLASAHSALLLVKPPHLATNRGADGFGKYVKAIAEFGKGLLVGIGSIVLSIP